MKGTQAASGNGYIFRIMEIRNHLLEMQLPAAVSHKHSLLVVYFEQRQHTCLNHVLEFSQAVVQGR